MDYGEFQERWEQESAKERHSFERMSPEQLLGYVAHGQFGQYYGLWRTIASKCSFQAAAEPLLHVLYSDEDYLIRYHCADALITLSKAAGVEPVHLTAGDYVPALKQFELFVRSQLG